VVSVLRLVVHISDCGMGARQQTVIARSRRPRNYTSAAEPPSPSPHARRTLNFGLPAV